jgi:hypothetical protein
MIGGPLLKPPGSLDNHSKAPPKTDFLGFPNRSKKVAPINISLNFHEKSMFFTSFFRLFLSLSYFMRRMRLKSVTRQKKELAKRLKIAFF